MKEQPLSDEEDFEHDDYDDVNKKVWLLFLSMSRIFKRFLYPFLS